MAQPELTNERAIVSTFQNLIQERDSLGSAVIERQAEVAEHDLVIKTLEPLDGGRKCHRLVGEVLVERTVAEVLPAVKTNRDNLVGVSRPWLQRWGCRIARAGRRGRVLGGVVPHCRPGCTLSSCSSKESATAYSAASLSSPAAPNQHALLSSVRSVRLRFLNQSFTSPDAGWLFLACLQVAQSLEKALQAKQKEVLAFQQKYNIRIRGEGGEEQQQQPAAGGGAKKAPGSGSGSKGGNGAGGVLVSS